ncbi:unnamed protein product [Ambrosiozyma monospora]|uniref:Unnamed protein product n=1 Tax=Ambrosiozyma monospora TaxID=43982 RepID=A0ACB5UC66_AMBMO|nr:unnamed protein product [Ambrosiozyma monospora]
MLESTASPNSNLKNDDNAIKNDKFKLQKSNNGDDSNDDDGKKSKNFNGNQYLIEKAIDDDANRLMKEREPHGDKGWFKGSKFSLECPNYVEYSKVPHGPYSEGPLLLPFMRPSEKCRTFKSDIIEEVIEDMKEKLADPDVARLFENAFPNTLDTTILWHSPETKGKLPKTFISTGDIHAEVD